MDAALKSLIALLCDTIVDCYAMVSLDVCATADGQTVSRRVEQEGESFLTISLPNFGSDFERSLDQGYVSPSAFAGFHRRKQGLPVFLRGFLERVFDLKTGLLLDSPCISSIRSVRQITLMFGKMKHPCSPKRERKAMRGYVECEKDVVQFADTFRLGLSSGNILALDFNRVSAMLFADLFSSVENQLYSAGVLPRHSSGSTADGLRGNAKYRNRLWTRRLEELFPHWEGLIPSVSSSCLDWLQPEGQEECVTILEPEDERPVKVVFVPKTMKTPRVIAMEPTHMQYVQQGLRQLIEDATQSDDNAKCFVSAKEQWPNQWLAREGSLNGTLATLDLSEASDRVSFEHVRALLRNHPMLFSWVDACRSRKAQLPDGSIHELAKFASMGSALCFPFEAMVFLTVVFVGIQNALNSQLTRRDIVSLRGQVRVYGDDIIVPVEYVDSVVRSLEAYGFKVNSKKSFWTGKFRESCGKEYYDGNDVSIVRCRRHLPKGRRHVEETVSAVSFRNQLFHAGYDRVVDRLDILLRRIIPLPYVYVSKPHDDNFSPVLGCHTYDMGDVVTQTFRWDRDLQHLLVRGVTVSAKQPADKLDDIGALMKWFLAAEADASQFLSEDHLQRAGRPRSSKMKPGWHRPF
jgi:hypothetical protein